MTGAASNPDPFELPTRFGPALLACWCLAITNTFSRGAYSEHALQFIVMALLILTWRLVEAWFPRDRALVASSALVLGVAWVGAFGMQWNAWNDPSIVIYAQKPWETGRQVEVASMGLLLTYLPFLSGRFREPRWLRDLRFALFVGLVIAAGVAAMRVSPKPDIDVWRVQQIGADALIHGKNPFTAVAVRDTAPGVLRDNVPYVYPPTQVYLTVPGKFFGEDVRYSMLAALVLIGIACRAIVRKSGLKLPAFAEDAPALFLWLTPKLFFILEQAWVDPIQICLITLAITAWVYRLRTLSLVLFGIVFSSKQTMFWIAPLAGFTLRWKLRDWIIAGAVAVAMELPFVIWDFKALKYDNLDFLTALPPRPDALTLTNWYQRKFGEPVTGQIAFVFAAIIVAVSSWKIRDSIARFGVALAATYLFFFAFNKWALANYYFMTGALAALAAAMAFHDPDLQPQERAGLRAS
ncbi:MAG: hypothetical protein ACREJX_01015 [Polyangiaceae bacterium]